MVTRATTLPVQRRAWETRERILTATVECLADEGYAATTTSRIQELSGVSRGSLLHQFPAREALLVAAVHHLASQSEGGLPLPADEPVGDIDHAVDFMWAVFQGRLFRASLQLYTAAPQSPELAAALVENEHELGRRNRETIVSLFGPELVAHPNFGDLISTLHSAMRGVALTYTFEPRDFVDDPHVARWRRIAHLMLETEVNPG
jgi:AcrR family transcriptional regulator